MTTASPHPPTERRHVEVRPGAYADSVTLLQVSRRVADLTGVLAAQVAMATRLNLDVLTGMGFTLPETTPNDMVVALHLAAEGDLDAARAEVDAALAAASSGADTDPGSGDVAPPRTTGAALRRVRDAALALVSVPGEHAFPEAMDALDAGCDVMIFSDNVPVDQEVRLKQTAAERDLLVMGPDCGTAVVGGVGLGFANAVRPGHVGLVAASGTGCQQLLCLFDAAGVGVSAALGVGGRDLSSDVGGLATMQALARLDADPGVERIVLVSKPPAAEVAERIEQYAEGLSTPVQQALLGPGRPDLTRAAEQVLDALGHQRPEWPKWNAGGSTRGRRGSGFLRGLFVGGTMCDEAMLLATESLGALHSNIPLPGGHGVDAAALAEGPLPSGHVLLDFGADEFTTGRAHPMIDPTLRLQYLRSAGADTQTAVVLLDVVLGYGAEPDPAPTLAPVIAEVRQDDGPAVVVSCVGTDADPQGLTRQAEALAAAGAEVYLSNAQATGRALELLGGAR